MLQQLPDAKYMVGIAHSDTTAQAVGAHDYGDAYGGFGSVAALRLRNQIALRNSATLEVVMPHAAFAEVGIRRCAAGNNHNWRYSLPEEVKTVVKACPQHRRGMPGIFRRPEHDDGVRGPRLL